MEAFEVLREVLSSDYRGPRPMFTEVHVLKALLVIGGQGSVGRGKLGSLVGVGQGEIRTLIRRMRSSGLIVIEPNGCKLTPRGRREFEVVNRTIPWSSEVDAPMLAMGLEKSWAVLVRRSAKKVRRGIEQRDAAVRAGAKGAFTAVFKSGSFRLPGDAIDCEEKGPRELWAKIRGEARPEENDVVVISWARDLGSAEWGAVAAALALF